MAATSNSDARPVTGTEIHFLNTFEYLGRALQSVDGRRVAVTETVRNAVEAVEAQFGGRRGGRVIIGEDPVSKAQGRRRLSITDNGIGMSPAELVRNLTGVSASRHVTGGDDEHQGAGFKLTAVPANPAGVEVISVQNGEAHTGTIVHDSSRSAFAFRLFRGRDTRPTVVTSRTSRLATLSKHGTKLVFHGDKPDEDSLAWLDDDPELSQREVFKHLNRRFFRLPKNVDLMVEVPGVDERPSIPDSERNLYRVTSLSQTLDSRVAKPEHAGSVDVGDAIVHWWLLKTPHSGPRAKSIPYAGHASVLFQNEVYSDRSGHDASALFGDAGLSASRYRVAMAIEPKPGIAAPDQYRSTLTRPSTSGRLKGHELPYGEWMARFRELLPTAAPTLFEVTQREHQVAYDPSETNIVKKALTGINPSVIADLARVPSGTSILDPLDPDAALANFLDAQTAGGKDADDDTPGGGRSGSRSGTRGPRRPVDPSAGLRKHGLVPDIEFLPRRAGSVEQWACAYDRQRNRLLINPNYGPALDVVEAALVRAGRSDDAARAKLSQFVIEDVASRVLESIINTLALEKTGRIDTETATEGVSNGALRAIAAHMTGTDRLLRSTGPSMLSNVFA